MRAIRIAPNEYYHVCNRAINGQTIFHDRKDYVRFIFLILYFQSPVSFKNIGRLVKTFVEHSMFNIEDNNEVIRTRRVELVTFCIMPNHFHLIVKELEESGIATYMQRVLDAYAKYYNTKYEKSGHLFQGPYRAVHIESDRQLMYLSTYIHRNPRELSSWHNKEELYPWSSYQDFIGENRWRELLLPNIILGQSKDNEEYHEFVKRSHAKLLKDELPYLEYLSLCNTRCCT